VSQPVRIGAGSRIADREGTHEPGDVVDYPSPALVELATTGALDPETGEPYCSLVGVQSPTTKKVVAPDVSDATENP